jgi:hypothetical protein
MWLLLSGLLLAAVLVVQGILRIRDRSGIVILAGGVWTGWSSWVQWAQAWTPTGALVAAAIALAIAYGVHLWAKRRPGAPG